MPRRGDVEHTYRRYARELQGGTAPERAKVLVREMTQLWWKMSDAQREAAPQMADVLGSVPVFAVVSPKAEGTAQVETHRDSPEDEDARRKWEAEVDARIAAAQAKAARPSEHREAVEAALNEAGDSLKTKDFKGGKIGE